MIDFKEIELSDKTWMDPLWRQPICAVVIKILQISLPGRKLITIVVAKINSYLVVKGVINEIPYYFYPAGKGDVKTVLEVMREECRVLRS